jgi:hypothetical protein
MSRLRVAHLPEFHAKSLRNFPLTGAKVRNPILPCSARNSCQGLRPDPPIQTHMPVTAGSPSPPRGRSARSQRTSACTHRSCGPRAHPLVLPRRLPRRAARATAPDQHMRVGSHRALHPAPVARVRVVIGEGFDVEDRLQRRPSASCHGAATAESAVVSTFLRAKPSLVAYWLPAVVRVGLSLSKPATAKTMR